MASIVAIVVVVSVAFIFYWAGKMDSSSKKERDFYKDQVDRLTNENLADKVVLAGVIDTKDLLLMEHERVKKELEETNATLIKTIHQKKSSEVKTGQIVEQLAPFLDEFKYDPKRARFIGNPIDFIIFLDEELVFIEVKSGDSQLNTTQRSIRDLVKEGKVRFEVFRVKGG